MLIDEDGVRGMRAGLGDRRPRGGERRQLRLRPCRGETVVRHGVTIIGDDEPAERDRRATRARCSARTSSRFVRHLVKDGELALDLEDEITKGTLVTRDGQVVHDAVKGKLAWRPRSGGTSRQSTHVTSSWACPLNRSGRRPWSRSACPRSSRRWAAVKLWIVVS